ncbi:MAG: hypothetical protein ACR2PT_18055 [Endozoicomonas sp.]
MGFDKIRGILKIGTPTFFIKVTTAMTIRLFNYVLLKHYDEGHVVVYGLTENGCVKPCSWGCGQRWSLVCYSWL